MSTGSNLIERHPWRVLAACLAFGALVSVCLGQDANWDLRNYHLYNTWALIHGRMHVDIAAAGMQSWFNPLLDLPFYAMAMGPLDGWPRVIAALQGLYYGAFVYLVWQLATALARAQSRPFDAGDIVAVAIGITGSATVAQIGATFNEMPLAVFLVAALVLLVRELGRGESAPAAASLWRAGGAGVLAGLAAGLKPTAVIYVPALGLAWLCALPGRQRWLRTAVFFAAAGIGFLLAYGWWGWMLYRMTGNPVFPLFNNVFQSDWVRLSNGTDGRFRPESVLQWVFYPFYWAMDATRLVTAPHMRDARMALAYLATVAAVVSWIVPQVRRRVSTRPPTTPFQAPERFVFVFLVVAYIAWLTTFSIYRYAIPMEALSGMAFVMVFRRWIPATRDGPVRAWRLFRNCVIAVGVLVVCSTRYPHWRHVDYGAREFEIAVPAVADGTLVLLVGQPEAYLAPFFDASSIQFIGINWFTAAAHGHRLHAMLRQRIASHTGPIVAVLRDDGSADAGALKRLHLSLQPDRCQPIPSNLERKRADGSTPLRLCPVHRQSER